MKKTLPLIIVFAAFIQRLYYATVIHPPETFFHSDMTIYSQIADSILKGEWKVSHFFQPVGFPLILAGIKFLTEKWTFWLSFLQALTGAMTIFFMSRTVRKLWGEKAEIVALIAGLIHVPWILYTGYAMPETIYTFLISILLWSSVGIIKSDRKSLSSIIWGVTFIVAFYIKGQHAFLLPLFLGGLFLLKKRNLKYSILISAIVISGMAAHWSWSYSKTGVGKISADTGGLNFVEGKCPSKKNTDPQTNITWWSPLYHSLHMSEHKRWDQPFSNSSYYMKEGMKCIARNPWVMVQSLESVPFLFFGNSLWPTNWQPFGEKVRLYEVLFVFFAIPGLLIFFLWISMNQRLEDLVVWGLPVLSLFLCVYVFKSEIRYRIPFDVFIIPMALRGWTVVLGALPALNDNYSGRAKDTSS